MTVDQEVETEFDKTLSLMWRDQRGQKMSQGTGDFLADAIAFNHAASSQGSEDFKKRRRLIASESPTRGTSFQPLQPLFPEDLQAVDYIAGMKQEELLDEDLFIPIDSRKPVKCNEAIPRAKSTTKKSRRQLIPIEANRPDLHRPEPKPIVIHDRSNDVPLDTYHTSMRDVNRVNFATDPVDDMIPVFQPRRFPDDLYTPLWTRGRGASREGRCAFCQDPPVWLRLKQSAYWYHLNYVHGICAATGRPYPEPDEYRVTASSWGAAVDPDIERMVRVEGRCGQCNKWISLASRPESAATDFKSIPHTNWYKHCQKLHT